MVNYGLNSDQSFFFLLLREQQKTIQKYKKCQTMDCIYVVLLILAAGFFIWSVEAQKGRQPWRQSRSGLGRRPIRQPDNRNRGRGRNARRRLGQFPDASGVFADAPNSGPLRGGGPSTNPRFGRNPIVINLHGPSNAMTKQNEVLRQDAVPDNSRVVISNPRNVGNFLSKAESAILSPTATTDTEYPLAKRMGKMFTLTEKNGKRAKRQKKRNQRKQLNKKKRAERRKLKRLQKQQELLKAEAVQRQVSVDVKENSVAERMGETSALIEKNGKRANRQKKRKKKKPQNKKKKAERRKLKRLQKQQKIVKAKALQGGVSLGVKDPSKSNVKPNIWLKRREKMLARMRARQAKLDERKKKEANIRAEKKRLRLERRKKKLDVKQNLKMNDPAAKVLNEPPANLLEINEPKGLVVFNKSSKNVHSVHVNNEATGLNNIVNGSRAENASILLNTANNGSLEEMNFGSAVQGITQNKHVRQGLDVDIGPMPGPGTRENQTAIPVVENATFVRPVVPGFTVNETSLIDIADPRDPWSQMDSAGDGIGDPAFLTPTELNGILPSNPIVNASDVPIESPGTEPGVPLGPADPRTEVLFGEGVPFRLVDSLTGVPLGPADAGKGDLVKQIDLETGVPIRQESAGPSTPFVIVNPRTSESFEQIDNKTETTAGFVDLPVDVDAMTSAGVGLEPGLNSSSEPLDPLINLSLGQIEAGKDIPTNLVDSQIDFPVDSMTSVGVGEPGKRLNSTPSLSTDNGENGTSVSIEQLKTGKNMTAGSVDSMTKILEQVIPSMSSNTAPLNSTDTGDIGAGLPGKPGLVITDPGARSTGPENNITGAPESVVNTTGDVPIGPEGFGVDLPLEPLDKWASVNSSSGVPLLQVNTGIQHQANTSNDGTAGQWETVPTSFVDIETKTTNSSSDNSTGESIHQFDVETGMAGIPIGPIETVAGEPLGTAVIGSQDNAGDTWFDPLFGRNQEVVFQSVDLSEFLSTGNVRTLGTNQSQVEQPKNSTGIPTVNGEVLHMAGQPTTVPPPRTSNNEPRKSTNGLKLDSSSLLGVIFDITKALRQRKH